MRRFSINGPHVNGAANAASNGIALIFHELATNAVKHGALRRDEGAST